MPTYEYACTTCGTHVEVYQRFSDDPLTVCGVCGGTLRKVFHPAGILFKGSGFYATDSRRSSRSGAGEKSSEGATSATGSKDSTSKGSAKDSSKDGATSSGAASSSGDASSGGSKERSA